MRSAFGRDLTVHGLRNEARARVRSIGNLTERVANLNGAVDSDLLRGTANDFEGSMDISGEVLDDCAEINGCLLRDQ